MTLRGALLAATCLLPIAAHAQPNVPSAGPGLVIGTAAGTARDAAAAITAETGAAVAAAAAIAQNGINGGNYLVCDGTTDNATRLANFQAAIAASPGKTGFIPPQSAACMTSANLQFVSNETVWAVPETVVLKGVSTSTASPLLVNAASVSNVLIYGLTFDGNLAALGSNSTALTQNVVQLYSTTNVVCDYCTFQNTRGIAFLASTSVVNSGVRHGTFNNIGNYWQTSGSNADQQQAAVFTSGSGNIDNFVTDSYFTSVGLDAISFSNQTNPIARDNRFKIVGGRTANGGACVYVNTVANLHITGNQCDTPLGNGYDAITATGVEIVANSVNNAGGGGIQVSSSSQITVTGNTVLNSNQTGNTGTSNTIDGALVFGGTITAATVSGNTLGDNQNTPTSQYGIEFLTGTITTTCTSCSITDSNTMVGNAVSAFGGGAGYQPAGVACSGMPSSSFATSSDGRVTHC